MATPKLTPDSDEFKWSLAQLEEEERVAMAMAAELPTPNVVTADAPPTPTGVCDLCKHEPAAPATPLLCSLCAEAVGRVISYARYVGNLPADKIANEHQIRILTAYRNACIKAKVLDIPDPTGLNASHIAKPFPNGGVWGKGGR